MFEGLKLRHWRWEVQENEVVRLFFDKEGASANTFDREAMSELGMLAERLHLEPPRGVVIASAKQNAFIAGADLEEIRTISQSGGIYEFLRKGQDVFQSIEDLPCPTIAAIHGACMGGGTELILACDHRIASTDASTSIGLPEVKLGIHPGWGGTVRLPRLIGPTDAMPLLLSGKTLNARQARKQGIVERIVAPERLLEEAERLILKGSAPSKGSMLHQLAHALPARLALAQIFENQTAKKARKEHYPAPFAVIDIWRKHGGNPKAMMKAEAKSVARLAETSTARNLVRVFFLRQRLRGLGKKTEAGIRRVHVVGAGTMGADIAAWCALRGYRVTLQDQDGAAVDRALERGAKLFEKKIPDEKDRQAAIERLHKDVDATKVADTDLLIEAIFENADVKKELYQGLEPKMKAEALIASNTSSIPLPSLAEGIARPERFLGLHFFNPVPKMPLVEVVHHDAVTEQAFDRALAFVRDIDKLPVPVKSAPGFLVNRILMPYLMEAFLLYNEGVPGKVVDKTALRFGMPMGPLELADQVGLDVCVSVAKILAQHLEMPLPEGMEKLVEDGRRGKKTDRGIYEYEDGKAVKPDIPEGYEPPDDLLDRLILPMLDEALACLREEVVADPELLDAGVIFGTGFAPFRGGPYQHIIDTGPAQLKSRLEELHSVHGARFRPDPYWETLIAMQERAAA